MPRPEPQKPDPRLRRPGRPEGPTPKAPPGARFQLWYLLVAFLLLAAIYWTAGSGGRRRIGYGEFRALVRQGAIARCVLKPDQIVGEIRPSGRGGKPIGFVTVDGERHLTDPHGVPVKFVAAWSQNDEEIYKLLDEADPKPQYSVANNKLQTILLYVVVPIVLIIILWRVLLARLNPASKAMDFAQSRARLFMQKEVGVTFRDVAGIDECKEELEEVIEFLRNPRKFTRLGGKIPKGVLLVGEPGTGKTLLARAVAGEAGVPFFSLSGSDFVEMFVGVGAARVRDLFQQAARHAPCIIFIDELDALGKARGVGIMGGHEEREQTLNALLVQMDGFEPTKGIILLGATNRPEMLDPALLRAGRFDRQIAVPRPDLNGRESILRLHTRDVKVDPNVDLRRIASLTSGFVGADLANLANEAALLAARRGKPAVTTQEFEESIERVVAGLERRSHVMNAEEKKIVASHEAGHALVACLVPGADPVRKISMVARGVTGLGYTMQMPLEDRYLLRKTELMDRLAVLIAGRSAEEEVFGEVSTGAQSDLAKATELARQMVLDFGMSEELGPLSFPRRWGTAQAPVPFFEKPWSEQTNREIDNAVRCLVDQAHRRARELIAQHRDALGSITAALLEKEVIDQEELRAILAPHGIKLRQAPDYAGAPVSTPEDRGAQAPGEAEAPEGGA